MGDDAVLLFAGGDAAFEEAAGLEAGADAVDVVVDGEDDGVGFGCVSYACYAGDDQAGVREEEGPEGVPVALLAGWSADGGIEGGDGAVDGF